MTRKRVCLQRIENESIRRSTFKKRKVSFFKKISELSTLCGVPACAVVYGGPDDPKPDTWSHPENISDVLAKFSAMSEADQTKKMVDGDGLLQKQVSVLERHLHKVEAENANLEAQILLNDVASGRGAIADVASLETVNNMSRIIETRLKAVYKRMEELFSTPPSAQQAADVAEVASDEKWISTVAGQTQGIEQVVPLSVLQPEADKAPVLSEGCVTEDSDLKYWFPAEAGTSTGVELAQVKPVNYEDCAIYLNDFCYDDLLNANHEFF